MANGRFSRGVEVVANASMAFVGNIDYSIPQLVNSTQYDLFIPLPKEFDLAILDRFFTYMPGWEIPKNSSEYLTSNYGFITDYLAEAFHLMGKQSRYDYVTQNCKFGSSIEGRDELAVKKTLAALLKLLHPSGEPTRKELEEYMDYALEGRRRVKEQMNKRKHDDEYARVNLSYFNEEGKEVIVWCPESKDALATQKPTRQKLPGTPELQPEKILQEEQSVEVVVTEPLVGPSVPDDQPPQQELKEEHYSIFYGDIGHSYQSIFEKYLKGCKSISIEDPYIRSQHQIHNLVRFCELVVKIGTVKSIKLLTGSDSQYQQAEAEEKFTMLHESLNEHGIEFTWQFSDTVHDREVKLDNGWLIKVGRGFDIFQKPDNWFTIGSNDYDIRPCLETKVDVFKM